MAEDTERSPLLGPADDTSDNVYLNLEYGSRRPSASGAPADDSLTVEELLYRMQYYFLDSQYSVADDVCKAVNHCSQEDIVRVRQELHNTPLPIRKKMEILRLLQTEVHTKRNRNVGGKASQRQDVGKLNENYHLFEGAITKITAYFGTNVASYFRFVRTLVYVNIAMATLMIAFIVVPQIIDGKFNKNVTYGGHFGDLSNSIMFYGMYAEMPKYSYNMPLAYFLTWLGANLFGFMFVVTLMIVRYRRSKLSEDRGNEYKFCWRTFCMWDYSIFSRPAVIDQGTSLRTEIKEMVREEKSSVQVDLYTRCVRYAGRAVGNVIVVGLLVGSGLLIYKVADTENILPDGASTELKDLFQKYQLTAVVAGLKFVVPPIFQQLIGLEGWHPRVETKITLARTTVFYIASLMVFVTSLYDVTDDCASNSTLVANEQKNESCCWENEVGEEVFKVILVDLGLIIVVGSIFHLSRALIAKCTCKYIGYSKFDIVSCVLDVVYGQGLIWLGLYFSPLLAGVGIVKLVVTFYFRYCIAKVAMVPPQQLFRASSTGNFYLAILLLILFVSLFPISYAVIEFRPSTDCGPFSEFERPYHVISRLVGDFPAWLEDILEYLGTPAVFVPVLIFVILLAVYFKVKSSSYKRVISELRRQLKFERKVEKRKIFATGRAMSGGVLSRYVSQESVVSAAATPKILRQRRTSQKSADVRSIEEEHDV